MMTIEAMVDHMTADLLPSEVPAVPQPCPEQSIMQAEAAFKQALGVEFPEVYKRILRRANGVMYNGLTIWPAVSEPLFQETLLEANNDLRDAFSEEFIYFGQLDEELYVLQLNSQTYCAIEFVGKPIWKRFRDAHEMFEFMLNRAFSPG
ncbi:SMI1/KNR4 family protein [Pseudomonas sp. NPDC089734]|uniref:SMI1/KNR4 family protein n=1 Tax=Pseudomonas sp. NPDC089734 TaxID=3364469 RepID=UPI0037F83E0D